MRNVNKLKDNALDVPLNPEEISHLRLEHVRKNPDLVTKIFAGDATALEEFSNFGGILAKSLSSCNSLNLNLLALGAKV